MNTLLRKNRLFIHALSTLVLISFLGNTAAAQPDSIKDVADSTHFTVVKKQEVKRDAFINALPVSFIRGAATTSLTDLKSAINRQPQVNAASKNNTSKSIINLLGISALSFLAQKTNHPYQPYYQY